MNDNWSKPPKKPSESPFNPYGSPAEIDSPIKSVHYEYQGQHRGTLVLSLGVTSLSLFMVSLACCTILTFLACPIGLGAWIMGRADLRAIDEGRLTSSGKEQLQIGSVLGLVGGILSAVASLIQLGVIVFMLFVVVQSGASI